MRFVMERISGPEIEPVTLAEMKRHLRCFVDLTDEDDDITALIVAAREWVENFTGRILMDQTWRLVVGDTVSIDRVQRADCCYGPLVMFRQGEIYLRKSPVLAVSSVVSVDSSGAETAIDASAYELRDADSKWPRLVRLDGSLWSTGTYRITFRAGYADLTGSPQESASVVPVLFKQAMKLWAEANYDRNKDTMELLLKSAADLIRSERCETGLA